jgi:cell division septal protein FtsQ
MSALYAVVSLLAANFVRVLDALGVSQTGSSTVNSAYAWLLTLNPIILIILGIIVFFAGKLAKFVGIIMLIVGLILLVVPYVMH